MGRGTPSCCPSTARRCPCRPDADGEFVRTDERHGAPFAIVLISRSGGTMSLQQFRTLGIEPTDMPIVVAKGVHSPRPAVEPIAHGMIWVATPGVTPAGLSTFVYRHRRMPIGPLDPGASWGPA